MSDTKAPPASEPDTAETRREIRRLTFRGLLVQAGFNYERYQNLGFWWMMRPLLDKLYPGKAERAAAYQRHLVYFNTHPWLIGPIAGVTAVMERQRANRAENIDDETISSVKIGLMAPLAGIGDSLVFGTLRPILGAVCAAMAVTGNVAGALIFFFGLLAIQFGIRFWTTSAGYHTGVRFFDRISPETIDRIRRGATMVGLAVAGGLVATLLKVQTPWTYTNGHQKIKLQDQLDAVLPAMLPLAVTLLVFVLLRRRVSPVWVLLGTLVVGLVLGYFGVLG
ncbi:PTS system mannose/fructose/sorbose family transporter subunit IID [Actinocatenispora sera]|uniref:PTS mannose transporter subunit IID n=1 Tax=Actinocatenispora sera TaxID=390989 RepID=A0A810L963_9ACTN|nr:PTS system mannose/fructose/sorbose family transporter subunit IID [Actinocatenispora sera]BCJ30861.1 PTS mannose transporter subunit IID [Actinocatenispora sera]